MEELWYNLRGLVINRVRNAVQELPTWPPWGWKCECSRGRGRYMSEESQVVRAQEKSLRPARRWLLLREVCRQLWGCAGCHIFLFKRRGSLDMCVHFRADYKTGLDNKTDTKVLCGQHRHTWGPEWACWPPVCLLCFISSDQPPSLQALSQGLSLFAIEPHPPLRPSIDCSFM